MLYDRLHRMQNVRCLMVCCLVGEIRAKHIEQNPQGVLGISLSGTPPKSDLHGASVSLNEKYCFTSRKDEKKNLIRQGPRQ